MSTPLDRARQNKLYGAEATTRELQADLARLREFDRHSEQRAGIWKLVAFAGGGTLALAIVLGFLTGMAVPALIGGLAVAGLLGLIVGGFLAMHHGQGNFEDRRYELLDAVLELVGRDTAADERLRVQLDLRKPGIRPKLARKGKSGGWNVSYYEDPWLTLCGRLLDGTRYQLTMIEHYQYRSRWKRNARGKTKHKSKTKSALTAVLQLRPKITRYANLEQFSQDITGAVQLPGWVTLKSVEARQERMVLKVHGRADWNVSLDGRPKTYYDGKALVAMMFLSLYQVLNLARRVTKRTPPKGPADET